MESFLSRSLDDLVNHQRREQQQAGNQASNMQLAGNTMKWLNKQTGQLSFRKSFSTKNQSKRRNWPNLNQNRPGQAKKSVRVNLGDAKFTQSKSNNPSQKQANQRNFSQTHIQGNSGPKKIRGSVGLWNPKIRNKIPKVGGVSPGFTNVKGAAVSRVDRFRLVRQRMRTNGNNMRAARMLTVPLSNAANTLQAAHIQREVNNSKKGSRIMPANSLKRRTQFLAKNEMAYISKGNQRQRNKKQFLTLRPTRARFVSKARISNPLKVPLAVKRVISKNKRTSNFMGESLPSYRREIQVVQPSQNATKPDRAQHFLRYPTPVRGNRKPSINISLSRSKNIQRPSRPEEFYLLRSGKKVSLNTGNSTAKKSPRSATQFRRNYADVYPPEMLVGDANEQSLDAYPRATRIHDTSAVHEINTHYIVRPDFRNEALQTAPTDSQNKSFSDISKNSFAQFDPQLLRRIRVEAVLATTPLPLTAQKLGNPIERQ